MIRTLPMLLALSGFIDMYGAAHQEQKIISCIAALGRYMPSRSICELEVLRPLVQCVTGHDYDEDAWDDMRKRPNEWAGIVTQITGLPIEKDAVMIPLHIEFKTHYPILVPRYYPYTWFMRAKNDDVVQVSLACGAYALQLRFVSQPGEQIPFYAHAAYLVVDYLVEKNGIDDPLNGLILSYRKLIDIPRADPSVAAIMARQVQQSTKQLVPWLKERAIRIIKQVYGVDILLP